MRVGRVVLASASLGAALAAGCSSSSPSAGNADAGAPLPPGVRTVTFSMSEKIAAGAETHTCQWVTAPADQGNGFVIQGSHVYTPGSHHVLLFRTDLTSIPAGQEQPAECYDGSNVDYMGHVRGIVYGAQTPTGQIALPSGVGLPIAAGEVLMMQTHYLNAGDQPLDARADVTLEISDGTGITTRAGVFFFYDPFIDVPPASTSARAQMRCIVPSDVTLFTAASHYHSRGDDYAAYLDAPDGTMATTPFYTSNDWDHPIPLQTPLSIPAGSRIRFSCGYKNTDPSKEYFQGQSAANDEMCMFIGLYYPEVGESADFCITDPDMFGTGTQTCGTLLSCLKACGPKVDPLNATPCQQKCFVSSCAGASAKLFALQACTDANCKTECADFTSSACNDCGTKNCPDQGAACYLDACQ